MTWITSALLMYLFSVLFYLLTRSAQKRNISLQEYSLWGFGLPAIGYTMAILVTKESLQTSGINWFWLIFSSIFFSWLGNYFSQKSMILAPNPGYPLIISKSYVVYTAVASIWLFSAPLSLKAVMAILMIVTFSAIITISRTNNLKKSESKIWFFYAMGAFFCWGSLALASKFLLNNGVSVLLRLWVIHLIVGSMLAFELIQKRIKINWSLNKTWLLFSLGISGGLFNYFMQLGFSLVTNPGVINAVNAASISAVTIFSAMIFKDELNLRKIIGIIGVTAGLIILMV